MGKAAMLNISFMQMYDQMQDKFSDFYFTSFDGSKLIFLIFNVNLLLSYHIASKGLYLIYLLLQKVLAVGHSWG